MKKVVPVRVTRIFQLIQLMSEYPPKTIEKLADIIEVSPKTVYKDCQIIESLGYELEKDGQNRYVIKYTSRSVYQLNEEEKKIILGVIKKSGMTTADITRIAQKLKSGIIPDVQSLAIMKQLNMIRVLIESTSRRMPVWVKNYKSTSPGSSTRDRHVFPLFFDENRLSLTGFDIEKKQPRIFKISRMEDVVISDKDVSEFIPKHIPLVDIFGLAGEMEHDVEFLMTWRAASLLAEEFMHAASGIENSGDPDFPFKYTTKVCGFEGAGRFVLGMPAEIRVVGNEGFKEYLNQSLEQQKLLCS